MLLPGPSERRTKDLELRGATDERRTDPRMRLQDTDQSPHLHLPDALQREAPRVLELTGLDRGLVPDRADEDLPRRSGPFVSRGHVDARADERVLGVGPRDAGADQCRPRFDSDAHFDPYFLRASASHQPEAVGGGLQCPLRVVRVGDGSSEHGQNAVPEVLLDHAPVSLHNTSDAGERLAELVVDAVGPEATDQRGRADHVEERARDESALRHLGSWGTLGHGLSQLPPRRSAASYAYRWGSGDPWVPSPRKADCQSFSARPALERWIARSGLSRAKIRCFGGASATTVGVDPRTGPRRRCGDRPGKAGVRSRIIG